jgi:hypothetical protein
VKGAHHREPQVVPRVRRAGQGAVCQAYRMGALRGKAAALQRPSLVE